MNGNVVTNCRICGEQIIGRNMHVGCIVDDIYSRIASGQKLESMHYSRAKRDNISIDEIRNAVLQDKEGKIHV